MVANANPATTDSPTDAGTMTTATMRLVVKLDANPPWRHAST